MNPLGTHNTHGHASGGKVSPEYEAWRGMKKRCDNPADKKFKYYGGRGIKYSPKWKRFLPFLNDMGRKPAAGYSLDRIDHNGDYGPKNCRWATWIEQENNRRDNRFITYQGKTLTVANWAREVGLKPSVLNIRMWRKWPIEQALTTPNLGAGRYKRKAA